jgi:hypothetical protein
LKKSQILCGLAYLESLGLAYSNLSSSEILISGDKVKLGEHSTGLSPSKSSQASGIARVEKCVKTGATDEMITVGILMKELIKKKENAHQVSENANDFQAALATASPAMLLEVSRNIIIVIQILMKSAARFRPDARS